MFEKILLFFLPFILFYLYILTKKPTNKKNWQDWLKVFPEININGENIEIKKVRNFLFKSKDVYIKNYLDFKFKLKDIDKLDYLIEPFSKIHGVAHTLFIFTLKNKKQIVVSVEVRKVKNQDFSLISTFFRNYELIYVFATPRDAINERKYIRRDHLYLYPIKADKKILQKLFLDILHRAKQVQKNPEFYHPWFNSCTSNLIDHVNHVLPKEERIKQSLYTILPSLTTKILFEHHFILNQKEGDEDISKYQIN